MDTRLQKTRSLSNRKIELLKKLLKKQEGATETAKIDTTGKALVRRSDQTAFPLSFAQDYLWQKAQIESEQAQDHIPLVLHLTGSVDISLLEQCLHIISTRHDILRSFIVNQDGEHIQHLLDYTPEFLTITTSCITEAGDRERLLSSWLIQENKQPLHIERGPLWRCTLWQYTPNEAILLVVFHRLIADNASIDIFYRELLALYNTSEGQPDASSLVELPVQYADYADWQKKWITPELHEQHIAYWRTQLTGATTKLSLPTDHPQPTLPTYHQQRYTFPFPSELTTALRAFCSREETTLYAALLSAFFVLLNRYSGQDNLLIGALVAHREFSEVEMLIGPFMTTLPLLADLSDQPTFHNVVKRVHACVTEALRHQDILFGQIEEVVLGERVNRESLCQILFSHQQTAQRNKKQLPGCVIELLDMPDQQTRHALHLSIEDDGHGLVCTMLYAGEIFTQTSIARQALHYQRLVSHMVHNADELIGKVSLLTDAEQTQLLAQWYSNKQVPASDSWRIHDVFEAQVAQTPNALALVGENRRLSYQQLNEQANQLAHYLQQNGVGPEQAVGIYLRRTPDLLISILAVLKAGGMYVPLDPAYPQDRLAFMMYDSRAFLIVTQQDLVTNIPQQFQMRAMCLEEEQTDIAQASTENVKSLVTPENLAYLIYTSGSTGQPKGVMIAHRNTVALLRWAQEQFSAEELFGTLASSSICFDVSVFELFAPLSCGGTVVLAENALHLPQVAHKEKITAVCAVPSVIAELLRNDELPQGLTSLNFAGEALPASLVEQVYQQGGVKRVRNLYGPTEDTTYSTWAQIEPNAQQMPIIGRSLSQRQAYVLDRYQHLVPIGVVGEIYLSGAGLTRGYWQQAALTAERFVPNPFVLDSPVGTGLAPVRPGARMYKTGDLGRFREDGTLEYLGRIDHQVKIYGIRIELGEIEATLERHPLVHSSVVVKWQPDRGEPRLVAYMVPNMPEHTSDLSAERMRAFLQAQLPEYMLPSIYIVLERFPLNANGKVDRRALPSPANTTWVREATFVAARTTIEQMLSTMWVEALSLSATGIHDNFFTVGGNSLSATRILAHVHRQFQVEIPLADFFLHPTISEQAALIEHATHQEATEQIPPLTRIEERQNLPLSFAQQRMWFLDQLNPGSATYNIPMALKLVGPLNLSALQWSLKEIVRRHESLRTTFVMVDGQPVQHITLLPTLTFHFIDLKTASPEERETSEHHWLQYETQTPFDLQHGPLFRTRLLRLQEQEYLLLLTIHHIIADGWSLEVLCDEFTALYSAYVQDQPSPLPPLPLQYADYSVWQRRCLQGETLQRQLTYWQKQLAGIPVSLSLPTDYPRPPHQTYNGRNLSFSIPLAVSKKLYDMSQREGTTLFMTLLAAWQVLLHRYSGQTDIVVGTPIANRTHHDVERMIGCFVNTLALRCHFHDHASFRDILQQVREVSLAAYSHQDLPFEQVVDALQPERDLSRPPAFQVLFTLKDKTAPIKLPDLVAEIVAFKSHLTKFDLILSMEETESYLKGGIDYNTDLFNETTIQTMIERFQHTLMTMGNYPEQQISSMTR